MKSFSILRTHTGLTTNVKIIIDSNYNLYLESIDSAPELAASRFKKMQFNKNNFLDELVPYFFRNLPADIAYSVSYENDATNMSVDFAAQYDDIYCMGARNILDNKNYTEEFEYFAPLYLFKQSIPKKFIIFRIDGPGLINLDKDNFRREFLSKLKTVQVIDLTRNTVLGEWIDNNFRNNISYPVAALDVDFRELEFTRWIGIDYDTGGYTEKSFYFEENLENENTLFDFEKKFVDGYKVNKIVYPHIINFSFLFNDTPATPDSLRKWSLNRYSGFYLDDLELIDQITPFAMPQLQSDVVIYPGNIIESVQYTDPFVNGFRDDNDNWVEYLGNFYKVIKFQETLSKTVTAINIGSKGKKVISDEVKNPIVTRYRIISDLDLTGQQAFLNLRECYINNQGQILKASNDTPYTISGFGSGDVNIIEIDGKFHNVILEDGFLKLVTDYGFTWQYNFEFEYHINGGLPGYSKKIDLLITRNNSPSNFKIYRAKFTDIKDFDTSIIDTEFSKFEYEKRNELTKTEETKMFLTDLRSNANPPSYDDFKFKGQTEMVPVSSDYTANLETFRISDKKLTDLWRKNPVHCRWGYQNSLSMNDYPYLLNNNDIHEEFNRTVNTQNSIPNRVDRNLDYFYTLNSGTTSYLHHSIHIEKNYGDIQDGSFHFELDKYLGVSYSNNYFEDLFGMTQSFIDGEVVLNKKKWSYLESGDNTIPNITVFRGLKFKLFEVDNIKSNSISIDNLNLFSSNKFQDYKLSILLSSNDWMVGDDNQLYKPYFWDYFETDNNSGKVKLVTSTPSIATVSSYIEVDTFYPYNNYGLTPSFITSKQSDGFTLDKAYISPTQSGIWREKMQWEVVKKWETDVSYSIGDIVIWNDIMFQATSNSLVTNPSLNPITCGDFVYMNHNNTPPGPSINFYPFTWIPTYTYTSQFDWVYRFGEYYQCSPSKTIDFWNPTVAYSSGTTVIQDNRYFISVTFSASTVPVGYKPLSQNKREQMASRNQYWVEVSEPSASLLKWSKIELWDKNKTYTTGYVIYNEVLYFLTSGTATGEDIPGISSKWTRIYSFLPDTSFKYSLYDNPFIIINDNWYHCKFNPGQIKQGKNISPGELTLDSGITIYINKKWKNVLINIAINDNTIQSNSNSIMDETRNLERDHLYVETNGRLTAANFIKQINDLDTLYGFADFTSYVVIEEDGTYKKYKFGLNIDELPYLLICEEADQFKVNNNTLKYTSTTLPKNVIKGTRYLVDGNIDNIVKLDFYNENPLGVEIENSNAPTPVTKNLNNQKNNINQHFFRHSGYYMPIFYEVQLFSNGDGIYGNYIFDTNLSLFGVLKQRVISKINRKENILKLKNNGTYDSIYPMLDEFGYMVVDFFIFKSTWDYEYHVEVNRPNISSVPTLQNIYQTLYLQDIVQKRNSI